MNETTEEKPKKSRKRQNQDFSEAINATKEKDAKEAAERAAAIEPRRVVLDLPVKLTEAEFHSRVEELLVKRAEEELLLAQKKAAADSFKAKIQMCKDEQAELLGELKARTVTRAVECIEWFDFERNTVETKRTDDVPEEKKIVSRRAMTGSERQLSLVAPVEKNSTDPVEHPPKVDDVPEAPGSGVRVPGASSVELVEDGTDIDNPEAILDLDDGSAE